MRRLLLLLLLLWASPGLLLLLVAALACSTDDEKQFVVTVATPEPLGLRLSEKLEVLEFLADAQGRSRAVEASGFAEIGDRLVWVNDVQLLGGSLADAVAALAAAKLPKVLRFQTHDGRCIRASTLAESASAAEPPALAPTSPESEPAFDYLLLSLGDKDSEQTFFGVLSADGRPPSCSFREVAIAFPFDACEPLATNATDKYVVVPSMTGCPAHQKAAFAQDAGAKGVVFVQHEGRKPQQVKLPAEMPKPVTLPLVMISLDSGIRVLEQVSRVHPTQTPQLRFVFRAECAADRFQVHPADDPLALSVQARTQAAVAGFLTVTAADSGASIRSTTAYEFLKPASPPSDDPDDDAAAIFASTKLPLGKHDLVAPDRTLFSLVRPCADRETDIAAGARSSSSARQRGRSAASSSAQATRALQERFQGRWLAVALQTSCPLSKQLAYYASLRASGVIFGDAAFPTSGNAQLRLQEAAMPFVVVSLATLRGIQQSVKRTESAAAHIQVEFTGESALRHHWRDLGELAEPTNWPSSDVARDRLFHRVLKDHAAVTDQDAQLQLARNERYDALIAFYWKAQRFYSDSGRSDDALDEQ